MKKPVIEKRSPGAVLCTVYLCLLGTMLPLTVHEAYYDITRTKATVFWLLSALLVVAFAVWLCTDVAARGALTRPSAPEWLFLVFALTQIVSTLLYRPLPAGLIAPDNRFQGILSFLLYALLFLLLRRYGRLDALARYALLLGFAVAALLAVAEVFGAELLGLRAASPEIERPRFFSTIGNISFLSALCVLLLPFSAAYALSSDNLRRALPYALCAMLFLCCGIAMRAESFVLGTLSFYVLLPLFVREARMLRRVPAFYAFSALTALLFALAMRRWGLYRLSALGAVLCSPAVLLSVCALSLAVWILLRKRDELVFVKLRKVYIILFCLLFCAGFVFLVLANTILREHLSGTLASVAVFSPAWGSDRGAEWVSFWTMFRSAPLLQKLIGSGAGSVADWDRTHRLFTDAVTDSAHNEYLHYLLTGGVIGLGSYLGVLVLALRRALQKPSHARLALALGVAAYAVQATVNLAQPFTTPLFFALLALLCSDESFSIQEKDGSIFPRVALAALCGVLLMLAAAGG